MTDIPLTKLEAAVLEWLRTHREASHPEWFPLLPTGGQLGTISSIAVDLGQSDAEIEFALRGLDRVGLVTRGPLPRELAEDYPGVAEALHAPQT